MGAMDMIFNVPGRLTDRRHVEDLEQDRFRQASPGRRDHRAPRRMEP